MTADQDHGHGHETERVLAPADWDEKYAADDQIWSGQPNQSLVAEVSDMTTGTALDVGCGEGADAVWLAQQGWAVTALDVSGIALDRARTAAAAQEVEIEWLHAGLLEAGLPDRSFDLVSAHYPALPHTADEAAGHALFAAVRPGGTLLFVHHDLADSEEARAHGFDPADYLSPGDIVAMAPHDFELHLNDRRPRHLTEGAGAGHTHDIVVRLRRRG